MYDSQTPDKKLEEVHYKSSIYISNDCEAAFKFDSDNMSPNISLGGPNNLTIKNIANKKWSTVRASIMMSSGLHRWDVLIDRCVSKNIFIGVASKDAKLDNYVGCDMYGWAFLANRAVWHNKSKIKAYGELFRTGDTVTVILDLDLGQLSFCLNDRPLGIAIEGITGPLYPAFSLYNEEDQLTIVQSKSNSDYSSGIGISYAEKLSGKINSLEYLISFICRDYYGLNSPLTPLREDIVKELYFRWILLKKCAPLRAVIVSNDLLILNTSDDICLSLSNGKLRHNSVVSIDKHKYRVFGVANHKLWLELISSPISMDMIGEFVGYSYDNILQLFVLNTIQFIDPSLIEYTGKVSFISSPGLKAEDYEQFISSLNFPFDVSFDSFKKHVESSSAKWTQDEDSVLVLYINLLSSLYSIHPLSLNIYHLYTIWSISRTNVIFDFDIMKSMEALKKSHPQDAILFRLIILIHLNDSISPILSFVIPYSTSNLVCKGSEAKFDTFSSFNTVRVIRPILFSIVSFIHMLDYIILSSIRLKMTSDGE